MVRRAGFSIVWKTYGWRSAEGDLVKCADGSGISHHHRSLFLLFLLLLLLFLFSCSRVLAEFLSIVDFGTARTGERLGAPNLAHLGLWRGPLRGHVPTRQAA
jgi:hypothetical protein